MHGETVKNIALYCCYIFRPHDSTSNSCRNKIYKELKTRRDVCVQRESYDMST